MKRVISRTIIGTTAVFALGAVGVATSFADDRDDDAVERKAFLASGVHLVDAITAAEAHTGARAMMAEFEEEDGIYIFEVELLTDKWKRRRTRRTTMTTSRRHNANDYEDQSGGDRHRRMPVS